VSFVIFKAGRNLDRPCFRPNSLHREDLQLVVVRVEIFGGESLAAPWRCKQRPAADMPTLVNIREPVQIPSPERGPESGVPYRIEIIRARLVHSRATFGAHLYAAVPRVETLYRPESIRG
jgi:hypothetical protein